MQEQVRAALEDAPPGPLRLISLCAGQGRGVILVRTGAHRRTAPPLPLEPDAAMFTMISPFTKGDMR